MTISDRRFGAAARTNAGRIVRFDSLECLAAWIQGPGQDATTIWVVDAMTPGTLINVDDATILRGATSPMNASGAQGNRQNDGLVAVGRRHRETPWTGAVVSFDSVRAMAGK